MWHSKPKILLLNLFVGSLLMKVGVFYLEQTKVQVHSYITQLYTQGEDFAASYLASMKARSPLLYLSIALRDIRMTPKLEDTNPFD